MFAEECGCAPQHRGGGAGWRRKAYGVCGWREGCLLPSCNDCGRYADAVMDAILQQQLDDVREALRQARQLIGTNVPEPPTGIQADPDAAKKWVV